KYHAGEVGVGTGSVLFAIAVLLALGVNAILGPAATEGSQLGSLDAPQTAMAQMGFKFLIYDLPLAILAFFAWSVRESYAGERLAPSDEVLRRDPLNPPAGGSVLNGVLFAPVVAAAAFVAALIPLSLRLAHVAAGTGTGVQVELGGPLLVVLFAALDAIVYPILALFLLPSPHPPPLLATRVVPVLL